jgi:hypothetical protein
MIADEGRPSLGLHALAGVSVWAHGHILAYGSRRDAEAELEQELVSDAFLAPRRVITGHLAYKRLQLRRNPGTTRARFPAPKQATTLAMPAGKGFWFHHSQSLPQGIKEDKPPRLIELFTAVGRQT